MTQRARDVTLMLVLAACLSNGAYAEVRSGDLAGATAVHVVREGETLLDIARRFDLGYVEMATANPTVDHWLPGPGTPVVLPTGFLLPEGPRRGVVVNLVEMRLYLFAKDGGLRGTWPLGIGRDGWSTPLGETSIVRKKVGPSWYPPDSIRAEKPELPEVVPAGPDNPLGSHALYLGWDAYLIHGTNKPWGVGRRVSHGCLRLYPEDIPQLFEQVAVGTPVTVVDQAAKTGWHEGELYLEVHPDRAQADEIEATRGFTARPVPGLREQLLRAAGDAASRIDWRAVERAEQERSGIPVQVTVPAGGGLVTSERRPVTSATTSTLLPADLLQP